MCAEIKVYMIYVMKKSYVSVCVYLCINSTEKVDFETLCTNL